MKTTRLFGICWLIAGALSISGSALAQPADPTHAEVRSWLEGNIPLLMEEGRMPGFSIAVVSGGETIYAEGFGLRDTQKVLPATPDTLYGIGSITKSFVAIGIMQLVEAGKIRLDDPVSKHIPFELGLPDDPITIHHLLTHSLGIPSLATSTVAMFRGLGMDTGIPFGSAEDFYRFVNGATDEVVARPGERFFYHNAAWRMLAHIIQVKTGMPVHEALKERVIDPLGMKRTTLSLTAFNADPDHILPHLNMGGGVQPSRFPYPNPDANPEFAFITGAGGIVSSVNEMTLYLEAMLGKGANRHGRVLTSASMEAMQTLHITTGDGLHGTTGYGYGLSIVPDFLGHTKIGHGGSIIVSTANMAFVPDLNAGVVMMGNSSGMDFGTIIEAVFAILMDKDPAVAVPAIAIRERTKRLTGHYETYRAVERVDVVSRGGLLVIEQRYPGVEQPVTTTIIPEDPTLKSTNFYTLSNGVRSPIEFAVRDDGKIDLFIGRYCYHKVD